MDPVGIYVRLWEGDGNVSLQPGDEGKIDAAVEQFIREGRDSLLYLTSLSGERYVTLASNVTGWTVSTPETRARAIELEAVAKEENKANRQAAGIWEDEE